MIEWRRIDEFSDYEVSNTGSVRNVRFGRVLTPAVNAHGVAHVSLYLDGVQYRRSIALLVSKAFLPQPLHETFNCAINLNGDRTNNLVENLALRPRWFAIAYHRQFNPRPIPRPRTSPVVELDTEEVFDNAWTVATTFGLLDDALRLAIANCVPTWPTGQKFMYL